MINYQELYEILNNNINKEDKDVIEFFDKIEGISTTKILNDEK